MCYINGMTCEKSGVMASIAKLTQMEGCIFILHRIVAHQSESRTCVYISHHAAQNHIKVNVAFNLAHITLSTAQRI